MSSSYEDSLSIIPHLSRSRMHTLAKIYHTTNDLEQKNEVKNKIIEAFARICVHWALHYAFAVFGEYEGHQYVDPLINDGVLGVIKALDKYDPDINVHFYNFSDLIIRRYVYRAANRYKKALGIRWVPKGTEIIICDIDDWTEVEEHVHNNIHTKEVITHFNNIISKLPKLDKEWVKLKLQDEWSYADISHKFKVNTSTISEVVKSHLPYIQKEMQYVK